MKLGRLKIDREGITLSPSRPSGDTYMLLISAEYPGAPEHLHLIRNDFRPQNTLLVMAWPERFWPKRPLPACRFAECGHAERSHASKREGGGVRPCKVEHCRCRHYLMPRT